MKRQRKLMQRYGTHDLSYTHMRAVSVSCMNIFFIFCEHVVDTVPLLLEN